MISETFTEKMVQATRQSLAEAPKPEEGAMTITPTTPSTPGALAGFETICPQCGMVLASTVEANVRLDAEAHLAWHEAKDRDSK